MTRDKFDTIEALADRNVKHVNRLFSYKDMEIHAQFMPASVHAECLIVRFHGAIQRDKRPLPAFQANLRQNQAFAHQITICDPTMMTRDGFSIGWYAGHDALRVQTLLAQFLEEVVETLSPQRTIYLGSSGGGFAALFYSFQHPGSAALVMAPQTVMANHIPNAVKTYLKNCWSGRTIEDISSEITTDLCELYSKGHENLVVYLQSSGDFLHNHRHLAPFVKAVHESKPSENSDFLLATGFWGKHGHGGAIPHEAYLPWIRAIATAPQLEGKSVLDSYHQIVSRAQASTTQESAPVSRAESASLFDERAIKTADLIRDYQLRNKEVI